MLVLVATLRFLMLLFFSHVYKTPQFSNITECKKTGLSATPEQALTKPKGPVLAEPRPHIIVSKNVSLLPF